METADSNEKFCTILRNHFNSLRQRQKQNRDQTTLTEDIRFLLKFVNDSVPNPIPILKAMGVINFRTFIAFNFTILQSQITFPKNRFIPSLLRDGWKDVTAENAENISLLVGVAFVKNWICFMFPTNSEIAKFLNESPRLIASEKTMNAKGLNDGIQANYEPYSVETAAESLFPLVSIQYERVMDSFSITEFKPVLKTEEIPKPNMSIFKAPPMSFRVNSS